MGTTHLFREGLVGPLGSDSGSKYPETINKLAVTKEGMQQGASVPWSVEWGLCTLSGGRQWCLRTHSVGGGGGLGAEPWASRSLLGGQGGRRAMHGFGLRSSCSLPAAPGYYEVADTGGKRAQAGGPLWGAWEGAGNEKNIPRSS